MAERRVRREPRGPERAERAPVRRDEQDRVIRVQLAAWKSGWRTVGTCELDQGRRAGCVVVRTRARPVVVAVRHHDDRSGRAADRLGEEVLHVDSPVAGDDGAEVLRTHRQAVRFELLAEPVRGSERSRKAVRIIVHELGRELLRRLPVECGQERTRERRRAGDAERGDEERQRDEQPRPAVHPGADGPFQRAGARPPALRSGGCRRHPGL